MARLNYIKIPIPKYKVAKTPKRKEVPSERRRKAQK